MFKSLSLLLYVYCELYTLYNEWCLNNLYGNMTQSSSQQGRVLYPLSEAGHASQGDSDWNRLSSTCGCLITSPVTPLQRATEYYYMPRLGIPIGFSHQDFCKRLNYFPTTMNTKSLSAHEQICRSSGCCLKRVIVFTRLLFALNVRNPSFRDFSEELVKPTKTFIVGVKLLHDWKWLCMFMSLVKSTAWGRHSCINVWLHPSSTR